MAHPAAPGAGEGNAYVFFFLTHKFQGVNQSGKNDAGGSVLVIVEDRNAHAFLQFFLNIETVWSGNIFEVDSAKRTVRAQRQFQ